MTQHQTSGLNTEQRARLSAIVDAKRGERGRLMMILHEVQEYLGCVSYAAQKFIAEALDVPMSEIYGIVTFYSRFTLSPVGKRKVSVCLGTACYVKGADGVLAEVENCLGIKAGQTSDDGEFSVEATRCIGACGLAPVMMVNEDVYGKLTPDQIPVILEKYMQKGEKYA